MPLQVEQSKWQLSHNPDSHLTRPDEHVRQSVLLDPVQLLQLLWQFSQVPVFDLNLALEHEVHYVSSVPEHVAHDEWQQYLLTGLRFSAHVMQS
jgi:hypothetical protein